MALPFFRGWLGEPPLLWAEFLISAMMRLRLFPLTQCHSFPLLLALELRPGDRVSQETISRFTRSLALLTKIYCAPPRPDTKKTLFLTGSGSRPTKSVRGATCCPSGASAASDGAGLISSLPSQGARGRLRWGNWGGISFGDRWQGRMGMQGKWICVIGRKASRGWKGLRGNQKKWASSNSPI